MRLRRKGFDMGSSDDIGLWEPLPPQPKHYLVLGGSKFYLRYDFVYTSSPEEAAQGFFDRNNLIRGDTIRVFEVAGSTEFQVAGELRLVGGSK